MNILLVDPDPEAANILGIGIRRSLVQQADIVHDSRVPSQRDYRTVDVAIINHNLHDDSFSKCYLLKQRNPALRTIVVCSPGESLRHLHLLQEQSDLIDAIEEKPLKFALLARTLERFGALRQVPAGTDTGLVRHLPSGVSLEELRLARAGDARMTERTVLFADIRRSTELLRSCSPDAFFTRLNHHLAGLTRIVESNRGEIIKYTGDGMLAVFDGFARRYLGFRCARELLAASRTLDPEFELGLGLADGLVVLGFIGTEQRLFHDVVGTNVNIAARFCAKAGANELLMTEAVMQSSGLPATMFSAVRLRVKGIAQELVSYRHLYQENPA